MSEQRLLAAIDRDDVSTVKKLLKANRVLATFVIGEAKLYNTGVHHWIYVGDTPLHLAAAGHRDEIARQLLGAGADPNSRMNHRHSGPLHYAADGCPGNPAFDAERQVETIRCLLDAGAEINAQDKNGAAPLHRAVRTRCADAVRFLLKAGADPALRNKPGSTPFHLAVQNTGRGGSGLPSAIAGQRQIIEEFLSSGVSPRVKHGNGKTVLDACTSEWVRDLLCA